MGVPLYIGLGWVAVFVLTDILHFAGVAAMVLLAAGGLLYTAGGIAYGIKKPNPWPGTFGYHEVFHAMTIVAAICHYIAVYFAMYNSPVRRLTTGLRRRKSVRRRTAVRSSSRTDSRPAVRQARATTSRSSSLTRLPITRSATVISPRERMPTGPAAGRNRGRVSSPASRRAMENASP